MAGTPEISLMNFMIGQMARFYKVPWRASNTLGGSKEFDAQAGYESATTLMAVMESLDSGKPIGGCVNVDIPETIQTILWHAEAIDKIYDQTAPAGDDAIAMIVREPIGAVGAVLPWNFPFLMLAWKIAPALAAGNSVIVKPAEQTSLTALRVAELAMEAGIPRGVLNVVTGMGPDVGEPLGMHPDVNMVSFTGSTETGRRFLRYSADSNLKKIVLECGGKNPAVVLDDAEDIDLVAEHIVNAAFWNMGENCSANSRLIVQSGVKNELLEKMLAHLRDWRTGDPLNPANNLDALIDKEHFEKVTAYLSAESLGDAEVLVGGDSKDGCYVMPTIIDGLNSQSGFGGRDNSLHAHDQYTELKTIWIDLSDRAPEEAVD